MGTPVYQGKNQPSAESGRLFARVGSILGFSRGGTPSYDGVGQPAPASGGFLGTSTPAYATLPISCPVPPVTIDPSMCDACPIDPDAIAQGQIAIVIPRRNGVSQSNQ